jgi:hypothetical protein|tara:strand:- start:47 stop:418 length:372 start_codon:yes stop_codon:yes gene_type:complete
MITDEQDSIGAPDDDAEPAVAVVSRTRAERAILSLLDAADDGDNKPMSLNLIAQTAGGDPRQASAWRKTLTACRQALLKLEGEGLVVALRKGKVVPLRKAKGLVRYARPSADLAVADSESDAG